MKIDFKTQAEALREQLVSRRRDLHMHPELGFEEVRTAGIVADKLRELGIEVQTGVGKTGVVGILEGDQDGPTVLVRADMDALPIHELNEVPYVSQSPGKMHACGHDAHTTIALGVAELLSNQRARLSGRVKFVFQPAEEGMGGARAMIADGALADPRPDVSLGLHVWNGMPVGIVGLTDGAAMAGASLFTIRIRGKGAHGAMPHMSQDPVTCAAQLVTALQTIVSRNVNPLETAVLSVTAIHTGTAFNVIPQEAEIKGTVRAFNPEVRDLIAERMQVMTQSIATAMACEAELDMQHLTQPVYNDAGVGERLQGLFADMVGADNLVTNERTMGSEDFSEFMQGIPSAFFFVGSANSERGLDYGHHHPRFDIDEDVLPLGVALMSAAVAEYLIPE